MEQGRDHPGELAPVPAAVDRILRGLELSEDFRRNFTGRIAVIGGETFLPQMAVVAPWWPVTLLPQWVR
jgi:hypothetical protein